MAHDNVNAPMLAYNRALPDYHGFVGFRPMDLYLSPAKFMEIQRDSALDKDIPWVTAGRLLFNHSMPDYDYGNADRYPVKRHIALYVKVYPATRWSPKKYLFRAVEESGKVHDLFLNNVMNGQLVVIPGLGEMIVHLDGPLPSLMPIKVPSVYSFF